MICCPHVHVSIYCSCVKKNIREFWTIAFQLVDKINTMQWQDWVSLWRSDLFVTLLHWNMNSGCECVGEWIQEMRSGSTTPVGGRSCHWQLVFRSYRPKMTHITLFMLLCLNVCVCVCTSRESWPGSRCLHILPCVGQHVVALGFVDQITTRLRRFDQLLVVHYVQQVGRVDEGKTHHCQQLRQMLKRQRDRGTKKGKVRGWRLQSVSDA